MSTTKRLAAATPVVIMVEVNRRNPILIQTVLGCEQATASEKRGLVQMDSGGPVLDCRKFAVNHPHVHDFPQVGEEIARPGVLRRTVDDIIQSPAGLHGVVQVA